MVLQPMLEVKMLFPYICLYYLLHQIHDCIDTKTAFVAGFEWIQTNILSLNFHN